MNNGNTAVCINLPDELVLLIDRVGEQRHDPTRSATIRSLILSALASMSYLSDSEKKALGVRMP